MSEGEQEGAGAGYVHADDAWDAGGYERRARVKGAGTYRVGGIRTRTAGLEEGRKSDSIQLYIHRLKSYC